MKPNKVKVFLDKEIRVCACCGKSKIKRTLRIEIYGQKINLGVTCAGNKFLLNLSGNPFMAAARLEHHLKYMNKDELKEIIDSIFDRDEI